MDKSAVLITAALLAAAPFCATPATAANIKYRVESTGLGPAWRLNNQGLVVGSGPYGPSSYLNGTTKALFQTNFFGEGRGVNQQGDIVGQLGNGGFYLQGNTLTPLPFVALDVNNSGVIVGDNHIWKDGVDVKFTPSNWNTLAYSINNAGTIVGWSSFGNGNVGKAFIYEEGQLVNLGQLLNGGSRNSYAEGLSENGYVTMYADTENGPQGYLYRNGAFQLLPGVSHAYGVNDSGTVVGIGELGAVVWHNGQLERISDLVDPDLKLEFGWASDINNRGQIIAQGPGGRSYLLTPVPEPNSWALMITGFGALGLASRRRSRFNSPSV